MGGTIREFLRNCWHALAYLGGKKPTKNKLNPLKHSERLIKSIQNPQKMLRPVQKFFDVKLYYIKFASLKIVNYGFKITGMRIIYVSDILNIHDFRFLQKLANSSHEIILYTFYHSTSNLPYNILKIPNLKIIHHTFSTFPYGIKAPKSPLLKLLFYSYQENRAIKMLAHDIEKLNPDVIFASWLLTSGYISVRTGFKKVVIMPWGSDLTWFPLIVTRFLSRAIEAIELSAHITVNCQHLKNKILEFVPHYPPQKISVIPWGIDPTLFNPSRKDNKFKQDLFKNKIVLISTRAFEPKYKPENIIKAVSLLSRKRDDFGLLLLGGGPLTRKILEMVKKAKLGEKIVYMGEISNEHVAYYLNFSNVYVSFSPIDGTSLCLEEAMMCGLPVIVVNYPSNREWVKDGENGFLFSLNNLDEFVQKISLLMDRNEMREKMGRENYRIAMENFDINKTFSRFLKMLEEVALLKC